MPIQNVNKIYSEIEQKIVKGRSFNEPNLYFFLNEINKINK